MTFSLSLWQAIAVDHHLFVLVFKSHAYAPQQSSKKRRPAKINYLGISEEREHVIFSPSLELIALTTIWCHRLLLPQSTMWWKIGQRGSAFLKSFYKSPLFSIQEVRHNSTALKSRLAAEGKVWLQMKREKWWVEVISCVLTGKCQLEWLQKLGIVPWFC